MLSLNLLPPQEKETVALVAAKQKIISWNTSFLFLILIFFGLLASVWVCLRIQLNSIETILQETESGQQGQAYVSFKKQVEEANRNLEDLNKLQESIKSYSPPFEALGELVPPVGLFFSRLFLDKNILTIEGRADNRDVLL
ncbi:MAG: hypothetical protein PHQ47_03390, partial [Candidatus Portnoybacteria bacterium]|nr:hypothetical protein [Candidatus Portnoybacteria bacterium]